MIAFFARRLTGGLFTAWAATFIFYSVLFAPGQPIRLRDCTDCTHQSEKILMIGVTYMYMYRLDKPWPENYASWLFNFDGTTTDTFTVPGEMMFNERTTDSKTVQFSRSSLLAGDFGRSISISRETPALDLYGIKPLALYSFAVGVLFSLMLLATLQRRGRSPALRSTHVPVRSGWRSAELWSLG